MTRLPISFAGKIFPSFLGSIVYSTWLQLFIPYLYNRYKPANQKGGADSIQGILAL